MIFLSYSWSNDNVANAIDSFFSQNGITIQRDRRDLRYKQSIKEFMQSIRKAEYVIMIISKEYLQSKNCMYEVIEFIKNADFKDKIIPIITENANIFSVLEKIKFQKHWTEKVEELQKQANSLDASKSIPIFEELREYRHIENEISEFLKIISDMKNIVLSDNTFNDIDFDTITNHMNLNFLNLKETVLNVKLKGDSKIKITDIIEFLSDDYIDFEIYKMKNENASFKFKTFKNILEIKNEIEVKFTNDIFEQLDCFYYDDAYYIIAKRKIVEYNSKSIMWWSHFQNGYTENLKNAGLYSFAEIKKIIKFREGSYEKTQLGIKSNYVDNLDLRIIPIDTEFSTYLVEDLSQLYGISDLKDYNGFS